MSEHDLAMATHQGRETVGTAVLFSGHSWSSVLTSVSPEGFAHTDSAVFTILIFLALFLKTESLSGPEAYHAACTGCPRVTASSTPDDRGTALCPAFCVSAHNGS